MKNIQNVASFIEERIGHIYFRPLMYGGTASCVDMLLHYYHELWAEIFDNKDLYDKVQRKVHDACECEALNFSGRFSFNHPEASELEMVQFVVDQWMIISKELGVSVPYDNIRKLFKH